MASSNRDAKPLLAYPPQPLTEQRPEEGTYLAERSRPLPLLSPTASSGGMSHPSEGTLPYIESESAPAADRYAMILKNLQVFSGTNPILRDVTLAVRKNRLLGVLGESGAGKTTFLRLIARKLNEAVLTISGKGRFPEEIWFIAQEDVLYEYDTPIRALTFLHEMLYGLDAEKAEAASLELLMRVRFPVERIYEFIGIPDNGLSVGSRRLLNVATALCAKAKVILLDEPTTGLDSSTAANLCSVLASICRSLDCTCICTIHQPSDEALAHFDDLIVMSEGEAYVAPSSDSVERINND